MAEHWPFEHESEHVHMSSVIITY